MKLIDPDTKKEIEVTDVTGEVDLDSIHPVPRSTEDLLTVVDSIYVSSKDNGAVQVKYGFERRLQTKEQVYRRINATVKQEWKRLDFGWLSESNFNIGLLSIKNEDAKPSITPTKEEKERLDAKVLQLSFGHTSLELQIDIEIPVGECCRFSPMHSNVSIRCSSGEGRYTLTAVPK